MVPLHADVPANKSDPDVVGLATVSQPDVWVFRHYAKEDGRRVYKKRVVGTIIEFPKRKDAEKAITQFRVDVNEGAAFAPMNIEQLSAHYLRVEVPSKAFSTQEGYKNYLAIHILPKSSEKPPFLGQNYVSITKLCHEKTAFSSPFLNPFNKI